MTGFYSIIQFCPDAGRDERVNLGLVVVVPSEQASERWRGIVRISRNNLVARKAFSLSPDENEELRALKRDLDYRLRKEVGLMRTTEDFMELAGSLHGPLRLSSPQYVDLDGEAEFAELYHDIVREVSEDKSQHEPSIRMRERLRSFFSREEYIRKVEHIKEVTLPGTGATFEVPYAFSNGVYRFIRPQGLAIANPQRTVSEAFGLAARAKVLANEGFRKKRATVSFVLPDVTGPDRKIVEEVRKVYEANGHTVFGTAEAEDKLAPELKHAQFVKG